MKYLCVIAFSVLLCSFSLAQGWRKNEMQIKAEIPNKETADLLNHLNINGEIYPSMGFGYLFVTPQELHSLDSLSIIYSIDITDLNDHYKDFWNKTTRYEVPSGYHSYSDIVNLTDSLVLAFPDICQKINYGTSSGGHELFALKITEDPVKHKKRPQVMFDAGIHGNEIMGPEICILLARELCKGYGTNNTYTNLINTREIWFYFMVNPDGRISISRYNAAGIDCNRNFGFLWDNQCGSGAPNSQPETKAIYKCMLENPFAIHVTYHSGTTLISYPWSYRGDLCPDHDAIDNIAAIYKNNSGYTNLNYGNGFSILYQISGSAKDAYYAINGSNSQTIELGDFAPGASEINTYYNMNKNSMLKLIEYAGYGLNGQVTDAQTGKPLKASIYVDNRYPCYTHADSGDFHKYLLPGTYNLEIAAPGYETKIVSGIQIFNQDTTTVNISLEPISQPLNAASRVIMCQAPGNYTFNPYLNPAFISNATGNADNNSYSIGKNGWVILELADTLFNQPGNDLRVIQSSASANEGYYCYAGKTQYGPWTFLGTAFGTHEYDLENSNIDSILFIKIQDDNDGELNLSNSGFDLDAVESIDNNQTTNIDKLKAALLVSIYPNPAKEFLTLESTDNQNITKISIYNLQGQKLLENLCESKMENIYVGNLPEGIYLVKTEDKTGFQWNKFIKSQ